MNIDNGASYLISNHAQNINTAVRAENKTPFLVATESTQQAGETTGITQTDFTNMSRQGLRDWANNQIRSGEMSLDDSRPFMAMSMRIPVNVDISGELAATDDNARYDFMQIVHDSIQGARSRNDDVTLKMLESAQSIMSRQQGQISGINVRV